MRLLLPDTHFDVRVVLDPAARMDAEGFYELCAANPDLRMERNSDGEIVIVAPAGAESDWRNNELVYQLTAWAKRDGRGRVFGPSSEFMLPDGSALSPGAAWVPKGSLARFTKAQRRKFLPMAPEFVAEVMSPSDRLKAAREKMQDWMRNGVRLGWLIDGDAETVWVYRAGVARARKVVGARQLAGEGPLEGFVLELGEIWDGL